VRHGVDPVTGEACLPAWTRVYVFGRSARAVEGCVCGLARFERIDVDSVFEELSGEFEPVEVS